ncbi:aspartyl protease family protein [Chryseobacterium formosense]|nr:aspartyl protease family protein [Chryseobacterium formosense]
MMKYKNLYAFAFLIFPLFVSAVTIPFDYIDGKIIINVDIKNKKHNFVFDTGALTIISNELQGSLNENKANIIFEATDANNSKSKMDVFSTDELKVADLKFKNINFSFADISWMNSRACKKISGIFGANMMNNKVWRIDFIAKTIVVSDKLLEDSVQSVSIPFSEEYFTHVPTISVKIKKHNFNMFFDTGAGSGFSLDPKSYQLVKDDDFLIFEGLLSQSLSSVSKGERQLDMMNAEIRNKFLGKQIVDSSTDSRNLIGTKFMENFLVELDFISKNIILHNLNKTPDYNSFGVAFAPVDDHLIVVNKLKIPQLSELNVGDKILKVNNIITDKINGDTFCQVKKVIDDSQMITFQTESGKEFKLEKKNILEYLN